VGGDAAEITGEKLGRKVIKSRAIRQKLKNCGKFQTIFSKKMGQIDAKRIGFLLGLALLVGLALVHCRLAHIRVLYKVTCLAQQEQLIRRQLWQQQLQLSTRIQSPKRLAEQVMQLGLPLEPPGGADPETND